MKALPNGCARAEIKIYPEDWNQPGAYTDKDWYLRYRFIDPFFKNRYPRGKLCIVQKGINTSRLLTDRRAALRKTFRELEQKLGLGYNPITKVFQPPKPAPAVAVVP